MKKTLLVIVSVLLMLFAFSSCTMSSALLGIWAKGDDDYDIAVEFTEDTFSTGWIYDGDYEAAVTYDCKYTSSGFSYGVDPIYVDVECTIDGDTLTMDLAGSTNTKFKKF